MNDYPKIAKTKNNKYRINTDFRVALKCNEVAESDVSDEERTLAIIYLLFGKKGLNCSEDWEELIQIALKYLKCGKEKQSEDEEADMDFKQDFEYIKASFFYDYKKELGPKTYIHWYEFYNLLCGLSEKCVLSRVRFIRNFDVSEIKDINEREKWLKQKKQVALKINNKKTSEERRLDELFEKQLREE